MIFVEYRFLWFLAVVFTVHWGLQGARARKLWLLASSYFFYGVWDWRFLSLLLFSTALDYLAALGIERPGGRRRAWVTASLVGNLGLLGFFKYYNFFVDSGAELARWLGFQAHPATLAIVLPVGISFYTFQSLSYTLDVYLGNLRATRDPLDFALYVTFFPQLVAGPIVRAADFLPQMAEKKSLARVEFRAALVLFFVGFFKKACVSDGLAPGIDRYFADPGRFDALSAWVAVLAYAVQIYCDFSGYTDMALAMAMLFGYRLCTNFAHPYLAVSITEFWRRWHISLSTWLRCYLYVPLGGNRGSRLATYRNLMLTMLLGGLWHGAGWNFVIWGGLHGLGLSVARNWRERGGRQRYPALSLPVTFVFVCFCWIFFRAQSLGDALTVARAFLLFSSGGEARLSRWLLAAFLGLAGLHVLSYRRWAFEWWRRPPLWAFATGYGVAAALVLTLLSVDTRPFIYFQF